MFWFFLIVLIWRKNQLLCTTKIFSLFSWVFSQFTVYKPLSIVELHPFTSSVSFLSVRNCGFSPPHSSLLIPRVSWLGMNFITWSVILLGLGSIVQEQGSLWVLTSLEYACPRVCEVPLTCQCCPKHQEYEDEEFLVPTGYWHIIRLLFRVITCTCVKRWHSEDIWCLSWSHGA